MGTKRRLLFPFTILFLTLPSAAFPPRVAASDISTHRPDRGRPDSLSVPAPRADAALDVESLTRSIAGLEADSATTGRSPRDRQRFDSLLPADASGAANVPFVADLPAPTLDIERIAGAEAPTPAEPRGDAPPQPPRRSPIPEPASVMLVLTGLIGLIVRGRLRRNLER